MGVFMFYNIPNNLKLDGGQCEIDTHLDLTFERPGGCPVVSVKDAVISGRLVNVSGMLHFTGNMEVTYTDVCCRCLKEIDRVIKKTLNIIFSHQDREDLDEDIYVYQGSKLNWLPAVEDAFIVALPYRDYCSDSCLGIDS